MQLLSINSGPLVQQPYGDVEVDWSNPLSRGLHAVVLQGRRIEVIRNTRAVPFSGAGAGIVIGRAGIGRTFYGAASSDTYPNIGAGVKPPLTHLCVSSVYGTLGNRFWGNYVAGNYGFGFIHSSAGFRALLAGNFNNYILTGSPFSLDSTQRVLVHTANASTHMLYLDGAPYVSATAYSAYTEPAAGTSYAAADGGGGAQQYAYLSLIWNRELSAAEVRAISDNPWQVLKPVSRKIWVNAAATASKPVVRYFSRAQQTQSVTRVNPSNPITRGLRYALDPFNGIDYVTGTPLTYLGTKAVTPGKYGQGMVGDSARLAYMAIPQDLPETLTLVCVVNNIALSNPNNHYFALGTSSGNQLMSLQCDSGTSHRLVIRRVNNGALSAVSFTAYAPDAGPGVYVATSVDATATNSHTYINGVLSDYNPIDGATGNATVYDRIAINGIVRSTNTGVAAGTNTVLGLLFVRVLDVSEIRALVQNPWQLFY